MTSNTLERPPRPAVRVEFDDLMGPPPEMMAEPRWVYWRWTWSKDERAWKKTPFDPATDRYASVKKPSTWSAYEAAVDACRRTAGDGVGFVLGGGWGGVDFDDCRDPGTGAIEPWAQKLISDIDGYAEASPSGTGVKVFCRADAPEVYAGQGESSPRGPGRIGVAEIYGRDRYFTVTAVPLPGRASLPPGTSDLAGFYRRHWTHSTEGAGRQADADAILANAKAPDMSWTPNMVRALLARLPAEGYGIWGEKVAPAISHLISGADADTEEEYREAFDEYSQRCEEKYAGREACDAKLDSYHNAADKPALTIGTLKRLADEFDERRRKDRVRESFKFIDLAAYHQTPPPPLRWVWDQWIVRGEVTTLYGHGGVGKSLLAQQLALAVASGQEMFGSVVEAGPVIGLFCEDNADELGRRHLRLTAGFDPGAEVLSKLRFQGRPGQDNSLALFERNGTLIPQELFRLLDEACGIEKPALVIIDNIAQVFGGDEVNRQQVTAFCNMLAGLADRHHCGVLLLGHVAKEDGSSFSGSTSWNNAVRGRLLLAKETNGDTVVLSRQKTNRAKGGDEVRRLLWHDGRLEVAPEVEERAADPEYARSAVLDGLEELTRRELSTSHSPNARAHYLPKMLVEHGLARGLDQKTLASALGQLVAEGVLSPCQTLPFRRPGSKHPAEGLARVSRDNAPGGILAAAAVPL